MIKEQNILEIRSAVQQTLADSEYRDNFSGVYSLSLGGQPVIEEAAGYAHFAEKISNRINTRFAMASGSKGFTAVAVCQLVEKGLIDLNTRLQDCLPGVFPNLDAAGTVKHLLTHTSGFIDYYDEETATIGYEQLWDNLPMYRMLQPADFLRLFQNNGMEFPPGQRFKYNNAAFIILALLVEKVSGLPFPQYVSQNIFAACGMKESGYFRLDQLPVNTAMGYMDDGQGGWKSNIYAVPVIGGGDGGAFTNASDMQRFWAALCSGSLLSQPVLSQVLEPQIYTGENEQWYGLGFWLGKDKEKVWKYNLVGGDPGVAFYSAHYPVHDMTFTIFGNRGEACYSLAGAIESTLYKIGLIK